MSDVELRPTGVEVQADGSSKQFRKSGFDLKTGIYSALVHLGEGCKIPSDINLDTATFVLSQFPQPDQAESKTALIDATTNRQLSYAQLRHSVGALATGLYQLGIRKGDVVFVVSPNSLLFPAICLAIFSVGAILSPANPINTKSEILKQVKDSGAKFAISDPGGLHKLKQTGVLTLVTTRQLNDENSLSVEELIESCDPFAFPRVQLGQSDTAAILYSSGTVAYVVRAAGSDLTANQVMQFVASQVAPYKKVRKVRFINAIPKSAAGKILRKELASESQKETIQSKL